MSMRLTEILAPDGSKIYIQYEEEESDALQAVDAFEDIVEDVGERTEIYKQVMVSTIRGYSAMVLNAVQESIVSDITPDKATMEFGLQLGGEAGVPFVTKGSVQANVKVTIEWTLNKEKTDGRE